MYTATSPDPRAGIAGSRARRRTFVLIGALLASGLVPGGEARARVNPLTIIESQIQKPNFLILLDTSGSMNALPASPDLYHVDAGMDCDAGDSYCAPVGKKGRCYMTQTGKDGPGHLKDYTSCTLNSDCTKSAICSNGALCTAHSQCPDKLCPWEPNNYCVTTDPPTPLPRIQMCQLGMTLCRNQAGCTLPGDTCGPATSRMVIAKRVVRRVVEEFHQSINFGMMAFKQQGYFHYYAPASTVTSAASPAFLSRVELEFNSCFSAATGPSPSCIIASTTYTLKSTGNSRYELNQGTQFGTHNTNWTAGCTDSCTLAGVGTGTYQGSHYTFPFFKATRGARTVSSTYLGRKLSGGQIFLDAPPGVWNVDTVAGNWPSESTLYGIGYFDSADLSRVDIMDTSKALPVSNTINIAKQIFAITAKVSHGGIYPNGSTPSGVALMSKTSTAKEASAYYYLKHVKAQNQINGAACRPNAVLFITDGIPENRSDTSDTVCDHIDCEKSPPGPLCTCVAVKSARSIKNDLAVGAKVYVVGFSGSLSSVSAVKTMNNIAKAGGTGAANFAVQEETLYRHMSSAIYDTVAGSYSTSPITVGSPVRMPDGTTATTTVLDSRVDFPSWKGHLIAYDISGSTPVVMWDAARWFDPGEVAAPYSEVTPDFWKARNVWTSEGSVMIKIQVDSVTGTLTAANAAKLRSLGLGATDAEAALAARFLLGDPALGNPSVLGAFVNSTPTQVGGPDGPSLTYVGSSDGMLHAFHSRNQRIGTTDYKGGQEAFAYIPQDMLKVIRRVYAQKGQRPAPSDHIFGLANSPKVKKVCVSNCTSAASADNKMLLVMAEGFGGNETFTLDITNPFTTTGVKTLVSPVALRWHTEHLVPADSDRTKNDSALGKTISLAGYYFGKSTALDDYRMISASGYTEDSNSTTKGLAIVTTGGFQGNVLSHVSTDAINGTCSKPKVDPTEPTILADVAVALRAAKSDKGRIAAAYVGDTWGNLFRYVPGTDPDGMITAGVDPTMTLVDSATCSHPLHFAPTVVQLDRHDPSKHPGEIFLVQLTNSAFDPLTSPTSAASCVPSDAKCFPPSQMIIRKEIAQAGSAVSAVTTWGTGQRIVLKTNVPGEICAVWNATAKTCTTPMPPEGVRPLGSSTALLRADGEGFALVTLWYWIDKGGCTNGKTFLTVHQVMADQTVTQLHGEEIGAEPVVGAVFVNGKLVVVREDGPRIIALGGMGTIAKVVPGASSTPGSTLVDRFRSTGWLELP
jgi:hypothetical protein